MAPVAGGIANGDEERLVFSGRPLKCFRAKGVPLDGLVGVLAKVGRRGVAQMVGRHPVSVSSRRPGIRAKGFKDSSQNEDPLAP